MSGHTKGPWSWSARYQTLDGRSTWTLVGADGYGILSCDGEENSPQGINNKDNACLIAAAPELLEALLALMPHAEHAEGCGDHDAYNNADMQSCGCGMDSAIELARAAIAKATGERA